jgi:fructokinase
MLKGVALADIIKISEEEIEFLFDTSDLAAGAAALHGAGVGLVFITLGSKGCYFSSKKAGGTLPTYDLKVVDTTGAGDAFMGGILYSVLQSGLTLQELEEREHLEALVDFANATGALATTKPGGILSMPGCGQVEECRHTAPKLIIK